MRENQMGPLIKSWRYIMNVRPTARFRKFFIVITYAWLLMNANPSYPNRALASMMLSRIINRSILQGARTSSNGGMSTAEVIALIQAMNGGRNSNTLQSESTLGQDLIRSRRPHLSSFQGLTGPSNRQLPVPVPIPAPVPAPPVPVPIAVVAAIVAAFIAATFSGFPPIMAIVSAVFAAAIAIIIAFLSIFVNIPKQKSDKKSPLIKKLVIKKTVLPFVIPIPLKSKEKKIIYKPVPVHHHHKKEVEIPYHHHHQNFEYKHKPKKKKYETHKIDHQAIQVAAEEASLSSLKKIERLILEQDHIQRQIDSLIEKENRALGITSVPKSKVKSKKN